MIEFFVGAVAGFVFLERFHYLITMRRLKKQVRARLERAMK